MSRANDRRIGDDRRRRIAHGEARLFEKKLHRFWSACVDLPFYDKRAWGAVQQQLLALDREVEKRPRRRVYMIDPARPK